MTKYISKRKRNFKKSPEFLRSYSFSEAVKISKSHCTAKFQEKIDVAIALGINPSKSEQTVRGSVVLPNRTGKNFRVAVFTSENNVAQAIEAGADLAGLEDIIELVKNGEINFDVAIATPEVMRHVTQIGSILGPKGLMPNPKLGTVSSDIQGAVKNAKHGQISYRNDKGGIIHATIGRCDFSEDNLKENLESLLLSLKRIKPPSSKGVYFKKLNISSTMGPGIVVDINSLKI